jgi:hypothetical protein
MKRFLAQKVTFVFPKRRIYLKGRTIKAVTEIESSVTDGTKMVCSSIFRNERGIGMRVLKRWRNYNEGVILTDKHKCVDLIYWSFIQYCYMFRPFTSAFIGQASGHKNSGVKLLQITDTYYFENGIITLKIALDASLL